MSWKEDQEELIKKFRESQFGELSDEEFVLIMDLDTYEGLSHLFGVEITCENQKQLALMGASKQEIEENRIQYPLYRQGIELNKEIKLVYLG